MFTLKSTFKAVNLMVVFSLGLVALAATLTFQPAHAMPLPAAVSPINAVESSNRSIDLGYGYMLVKDGVQDKIISPAYASQTLPAASQVRTIALGSGHWLRLKGSQVDILSSPSASS